jgi:hypothetical protein
MAWWDHEELKSKENRSLRYMLSFYYEYNYHDNVKAIQEAITAGHHVDLAYAVAKEINYKPRIRVKAKSVKVRDLSDATEDGHYFVFPRVS